MKIVLLLLLQDIRALRSWLRTNTASKMVVIFGFVTICTGISLLLYLLSLSFFRYLLGFHEFGTLTFQYVFSASFLVLSWFLFAASTSSFYTFLMHSNQEYEFLFVQPIASSLIPFFVSMKTALVSFLLLAVIFVPVIAAYVTACNPPHLSLLALRLVFVLIMLVLFINSIAGLAGYTMAKWTRRITAFHYLLGFILFFGVMYGIIFFIFPTRISYLATATPPDFLNIYKSLPLTKTYLPPSWLVSTIFNGFSLDTFLFLTISLCAFVYSFRFQSHNFVPIIHSVRSAQHRQNNALSFSFLSRYPIVRKDVLFVVRSPSETGYVVFLIGIMVFFYFLLSISFMRRPSEEWYPYVSVFSFAWLMFFATAYCLRLIYPLLAQEGNARWFLFSQPIGLGRIFKSKIASGFCIALPLLVLSLDIWFLLPFSLRTSEIYLISGITTATIILINVFMGMIAPDFKNGSNPEYASTSGTGMVTLIICFCYALCACTLVWKLYLRTVSFASVVFFLLGISTVIILLLGSSASKSLARSSF